MLVNQLNLAIATQKNAEIVEPGDNALQLHAIDEKDRERRLVLADVVEKGEPRRVWIKQDSKSWSIYLEKGMN